MGCIELAPSLSQAPSQVVEHQQAEDWPSSVQADFDTDVSSSLFHVQGNIMLKGNGSIPYLLLNATLSQDSIPLQSTKYLLLNVEPGEDHSFEISKNMRIRSGIYNCTLEIAGPKGILTCETRRCRAPIPWVEALPAANSLVNLPADTASRIAVQKTEKEMMQNVEDREAKIQEEKAKEEVALGQFEAKSMPEDVTEESRASAKAPAENLPEKENLQPKNDSQENNSSFQVGSSARTSSALLSEQGRQFVGSSTSKKYHRLDCRYAAKIKLENKIYFSGDEDARQQGYLPCKTCNP